MVQEALTKIKEPDIPEEEPFISPQNSQHSKRFQEVTGFAWFSCPKKHHRWPSAQSLCFIDLKMQTICHRGSQKCRKCNSNALPEFTQEAIAKMARCAVTKIQLATSNNTQKWEESHSVAEKVELCPAVGKGKESPVAKEEESQPVAEKGEESQSQPVAEGEESQSQPVTEGEESQPVAEKGEESQTVAEKGERVAVKKSQPVEDKGASCELRLRKERHTIWLRSCPKQPKKESLQKRAARKTN